MKKYEIYIAVLLLAISAYTPMSLAAEEGAPAPNPAANTPADLPSASAPAALEDEMEYSFGEVKNVSASELVLTEYDYLTDQESDVTYALDPALKLENVNAVTDLKAGDSVEIDYVLEGDKKIVKNLILEKLEDEGLAGEDMPAEGGAGLRLPSTPEEKAITVDDVAKQ